MTRCFTVLCAIVALQLFTSSCSAVEDDAYFRALVAERYVAPFREGNIDIWIQSFDEEAVALHNRRPIDRGRDAIEAFGKMVQQHFELREYKVEVSDIRRSQDWVYTVGSFTTLFVSREDGSTPFGREQGKFLLLWERQKDNSWKIILDMGNSNQ